METFSPSFESRNIKTPEEEIAFLRERLAEKERETGAARESAAEKTIEEYRDMPHHRILNKDFALSEQQVAEKAEGIVLPLSPEDHDEKIAELLGIMQTHGIKNALAVVEKMNNPHVQDDFERFLVQYLKAGFPIEGMSEKAPEFKALNMTLYEITLPEKTDDGKERPLKEILSSMEQFYAGMMSVEDPAGTGYFTIELAVANHSDEFAFHVAVHDSKKNLFEKQMLAIFHNAKITEKKDDYNIFNETGVTVASSALYEKNSIWPLKTYEQFDHDPLNILLNSFSKIKTHGEGAVIQIVIRPAGDKHTKRYRKTLEDIMKGENIKEAISKNDEGLSKYVDGFFKGVSSLAAMQSKEQKEKAEAKKKEAAQNVDQIAVEAIKQKISSPTVAVDIRVIASAENEATASGILSDIEASFNQFENTAGNRLVFERAKKGSLKSLLYDYSFRLYDEKNKLLPNLKELTSLVHFPATVLKSSPHLKTAKAGSAPAPLELSKEGVILGVNRDRGVETQVFMSPEDRLRHFYVIGQTGTGKTTLLKNMIAQDIANGEGVCMIDPHGSDIQDILSLIPKHRFEDVIYFDPSNTARPMALNMLEYDRRFPEQKTFVVNEMLSIFNKLFDMKTAGGPMFEQYFRNAVLLVMEDPESGNTLLDVSRVLSNKAYRELKISKCKNPIVVQFWKEVAEKAGGEASLANIVPYITSKFDVFLSNDIMRPIIAQENSSFNFREIMDSKKILLVNLSKGRLGDINANLIGLILVGKILMAALSRVDAITGGAHGTGLPPFYLYIDEFQNVTTNSISTILSEARKYKLSLAVAHQFIAQLEEGIRDSVFGNVGSIAAFRVGAEDAEYLEKQFSPVFTAKDIMSIDNRNAYLKMLANGRPVKPFNIETLPPPTGDRAVVDNIKELSYLKYGKDRAVVEAEIMAKYQAVSSK
jgi:type IV secretory pathway TraG/TraD family ATPase VirD4